jgi:uncharacterized repeat protein (TIGR03803 family)
VICYAAKSRHRKHIGKEHAVQRTYSIFALCTFTAITLPAQIFTTLHVFNYEGRNGSNPLAGLVEAANGDLYGTTQTGGEISGQPNGLGTVFKISPLGTLTTLHVFGGPDGSSPDTGLVPAYGQLYGTTFEGGASSGTSICYFGGCGTIFKIGSDGTLTTLHNFNGQDGYHPSTLIQSRNGDFYGTTSAGGANGSGTVFRISPWGVLTTLYNFCSQAGCLDGEGPVAGLVQADNGDFYGTTGNAGAGQFCLPASGGGCGTVFKITPDGVLTTLHNFCSRENCADGAYPGGALVQAISGEFYGTTGGGGVTNPFPCFDGCGTVFKIKRDGELATLYSFTGGTDGERPNAGLIQASDGSFYGTTSVSDAIDNNGVFGGGTIFRITPAGKLTTLHDFAISTDGGPVEAPLVEARDGNFYGTAFDGGTNNAGTVFTLEVFVKTLPSFGEVGCAVRILGTNLTGATSVTFNGVAAMFEVVSPFEIVTTVPPGASTGEVNVVTPGGKLSSNVVFRVP